MLQQLPQFVPVFLTLAAIGLIVFLVTEQSQIIAKVRGARRSAIATGYNNSMKIMIVNRLGSILYMFFLALSIDVGISNQDFLATTICAALAVLVFNAWLIVRRARVLMAEVPEGTRESVIGFLSQGGFYYASASFAATVLNILGTTMPLLLSNMIPEYRLSLANTSFLLNAFFTLINVLILEARLAQILDSGKHHDAYVFAVLVFLTRSVATITTILVFAGLWWVL